VAITNLRNLLNQPLLLPLPPHLKPQPLLWLPHLKLLLHLLLLLLLPHQELRLLPLQPQLPLPQPLVANAKPLS